MIGWDSTGHYGEDEIRRDGKVKTAESRVRILGWDRGSWILDLESPSGIPMGEQVLPLVHYEVRVGSWSGFDVLGRCVGQCEGDSGVRR
jgi:hypothetical protein